MAFPVLLRLLTPTHLAREGWPWFGFRGFLALIVVVERPFFMGTCTERGEAWFLKLQVMDIACP